MTLLVQPMKSAAPLSTVRAVRRQHTGQPFPGRDSTLNHTASTGTDEGHPLVVTAQRRTDT
jgi:hypothetical protein